jgi:hypothetical protein
VDTEWYRAPPFILQDTHWFVKYHAAVGSQKTEGTPTNIGTTKHGRQTGHGLNIEVGGYTDNVAASVSATGFGSTLPVASNSNAAGRQHNRRVELLVSGDAIGDSASVTTGSLR